MHMPDTYESGPSRSPFVVALLVFMFIGLFWGLALGWLVWA
jgi:hypothetical protein